MRKLLILTLLLPLLALPVSATEITVPAPPSDAEALMPQEPETFTDGLLEILRSVLPRLQPAFTEALGTCCCIIGSALLLSLLASLEGHAGNTAELAAAVGLGGFLLSGTDSLIILGSDTVRQLSEYGKLLIPIMTTALAASGSVTASGALYAGTVFFDTLLTTLISSILVPMVYVFLCLNLAGAALGSDLLSQLKGTLKWLMTWCLKIILYVFTGYISITGVISGSADAAALKATKLTISGMIPVVGGILSDASEAVLVGSDVLRNSLGGYGLLAVLAIWIGPFLQLGIQYLLLKVTAAVCGIFSSKRLSALVEDFSGALGFLLAMTGSVCLLLLISIVCFMKGVG